MGFLDDAVVKNKPANAGDTRHAGLIPGWGRSPEVGNGNPLQYFCLENYKDRRGWGALVQGVTKSHSQLSTLPATPKRMAGELLLFF